MVNQSRGELNLSDFCAEVMESSAVYKPGLYPQWALTLHMATYIAILVTSLVANLIIIIIVIVDRPIRTHTGPLMISLVTADLGLAGIVQVINVHFMTQGKEREVDHQTCSLITALETYFCVVVMLHLFFLAVDQYLAICTPYRYLRMNRRWMACMMTTAWIVPIFFTILPITSQWHEKGLEDLYACLHQIKNHFCNTFLSLPYALTVFVCLFLLPSVIMVFCYVRIYLEASRHSRMIRKLSPARIASVRNITEMVSCGQPSDIESVPVASFEEETDGPCWPELARGLSSTGELGPISGREHFAHINRMFSIEEDEPPSASTVEWQLSYDGPNSPSGMESSASFFPSAVKRTFSYENRQMSLPRLGSSASEPDRFTDVQRMFSMDGEEPFSPSTMRRTVSYSDTLISAPYRKSSVEAARTVFVHEAPSGMRRTLSDNNRVIPPSLRESSPDAGSRIVCSLRKRNRSSSLRRRSCVPVRKIAHSISFPLLTSLFSVEEEASDEEGFSVGLDLAEFTGCDDDVFSFTADAQDGFTHSTGANTNKKKPHQPSAKKASLSNKSDSVPTNCCLLSQKSGSPIDSSQSPAQKCQCQSETFRWDVNKAKTECQLRRCLSADCTEACIREEQESDCNGNIICSKSRHSVSQGGHRHISRSVSVPCAHTATELDFAANDELVDVSDTRIFWNRLRRGLFQNISLTRRKRRQREKIESGGPCEAYDSQKLGELSPGNTTLAGDCGNTGICIPCSHSWTCGKAGEQKPKPKILTSNGSLPHGVYYTPRRKSVTFEVAARENDRRQSLKNRRLKSFTGKNAHRNAIPCGNRVSVGVLASDGVNNGGINPSVPDSTPDQDSIHQVRDSKGRPRQGSITSDKFTKGSNDTDRCVPDTSSQKNGSISIIRQSSAVSHQSRDRRISMISQNSVAPCHNRDSQGTISVSGIAPLEFASPCNERTCSGQKTCKARRRSQDLKATRTIAMIFTCFSIAWVPYWTVLILQPCLGYLAVPEYVWGICELLAYIGCLCNPFIYFFSHKEVRDGLLRVFLHVKRRVSMDTSTLSV